MARPAGTTRAKKPILKKEFDRLINAVKRSHHIKNVTKPKLIRSFTLLYLTGCRISEIAKLKTEDIEYMINSNEYSLPNNTKTGLSRLISFDENCVQIEFLKKILPSYDEYLFVKNNSTKPMTVGGLTNLVNGFIHEVLGFLYSTHSFRGGYVTISHQVGLSLEHIREDIGHKNIATTARYATVTSQEISHGKTLRQW